jgi:hypothetical protein
MSSFVMAMYLFYLILSMTVVSSGMIVPIFSRNGVMG